MVISEVLKLQASLGSVPLFISVWSSTPSSSQSLTAVAMRSILTGLSSHGSKGSVLSINSFALETPSASQSRLEVTDTVML